MSSAPHTQKALAQIHSDLESMIQTACTLDPVIFEPLRNQHLIITGGTGFFGRWLLESILALNQKLQINASATVISRNPSQFETKAPHFFEQNSPIKFLKGDVTTLNPAEVSKNFSSPPFAIIHAATDARATFNEKEPLAMAESVVKGTQNILELARTLKAKRFLFTSTGAVYGPQPPSVTHVDETYPGGPDPLVPYSSYAESKRMAEFYCAAYARAFGIEMKIARCFAFVGPGLPLDEHFAIGNFIRDIGLSKKIQINGDGTPRRSYLYASDLCLWLWRILLNGKSLYPYNVGSEESVSILELAQTVVKTLSPETQIEILKPRMPDDHSAVAQYVPCTKRAQSELGLKQTVSLSDSIRRTFRFNFG